MMQCCDENELLSSAHYGFRPKLSCIDATNHGTEYMRAKIDLKYTGQPCFIDLRKYSIQKIGVSKTKLNYDGFRGPINELLELIK